MSEAFPTLGFRPLPTTLPIMEIRYLVKVLRKEVELDWRAGLHAFTNTLGFIVGQLDDEQAATVENLQAAPLRDEELLERLERLDPESEKYAGSLLGFPAEWWKQLAQSLLRQLLDRYLGS